MKYEDHRREVELLGNEAETLHKSESLAGRKISFALLLIPTKNILFFIFHENYTLYNEKGIKGL